MRSRNIKPGFFRNEDLTTLPPLCRILFLGLTCLADRKGRLENRPRRIKADIFPYEDCDMVTFLKDLERLEFIKIYGKYIQIVNFLKHQNPHIKEAESKIPPPPTEEIIQEPGAKTGQEPDKNQKSMEVATLIPDSGFLIPVSPPNPPPGERVILPMALERHRSAIEKWLAYKREKGQRYKPRGLEALLEKLLKIPPDKLSESISESMANGYSGIFEKKSAGYKSDQELRSEALARSDAQEKAVKHAWSAQGLSACHGSRIEIIDGISRCKFCLAEYRPLIKIKLKAIGVT